MSLTDGACPARPLDCSIRTILRIHFSNSSARNVRRTRQRTTGPKREYPLGLVSVRLPTRRSCSTHHHSHAATVSAHHGIHPIHHHRIHALASVFPQHARPRRHQSTLHLRSPCYCDMKSLARPPNPGRLLTLRHRIRCDGRVISASRQCARSIKLTLDHAYRLNVQGWIAGTLA